MFWFLGAVCFLSLILANFSKTVKFVFTLLGTHNDYDPALKLGHHLVSSLEIEYTLDLDFNRNVDLAFYFSIDIDLDIDLKLDLYYVCT